MLFRLGIIPPGTLGTPGDSWGRSRIFLPIGNVVWTTVAIPMVDDHLGGNPKSPEVSGTRGGLSTRIDTAMTPGVEIRDGGRELT
jgi:hypothetical protein